MISNVEAMGWSRWWSVGCKCVDYVVPSGPVTRPGPRVTSHKQTSSVFTWPGHQTTLIP